MLNKVKVSTIPLQNGECAVEIVITIGTEQPKKVKQESPIYAETLEALAETWMYKLTVFYSSAKKWLRRYRLVIYQQSGNFTGKTDG